MNLLTAKDAKTAKKAKQFGFTQGFGLGYAMFLASLACLAVKEVFL